jgi:septal ring factor EnvC (AmiA/AmiB activator)
MHSTAPARVPFLLPARAERGHEMAEEEKQEQAEQQESKAEEAHAVNAEEIDWKAEARKWEARSKENKTAADELAQLKEAEKSEIQKANEKAAKAEAKANAYELEKSIVGWKADVSKKTGIPAEVLAGSTEEEIEAHAASLAPYFKKHPAPVVKGDGYRPAGEAGKRDPMREMITNKLN